MEIGVRKKPWKILYGMPRKIDMICVEPDESERSILTVQLNRTPWHSWKIIPKALGQKEDIRTLYITQQPGLSSLYRPNTSLIKQYQDIRPYTILHEAKVPVVTLDSLAQSYGFRDGIDLLKVDTQGSEYDILRGANSTLQRTQVIYVEMEFVELYEGQPLFGDIHAYLSEQGFYLHDLLRVRYRHQNDIVASKPQLFFGYGIYVKRQPRDAAKCAAALALMGYIDAAEALFPAAHEEFAQIAKQLPNMLKRVVHHDRKDGD